MLTTLLSLRTFMTGCLLIMVSLTALRSVAAHVPSSPHTLNRSGRVLPASIADRIVGRWYFSQRGSDIEIYRERDHYFAKIVAVNEATTAEYGSMNNRILLTDLTFSRNEWSGGQLIHPQTGSRFDVFLRLTNDNTLVITAYKGCRLFNRSYTLTRI